MDYSVWFFITSGLFLGWSLGANHAVNVFGTAVVSRMVKFKNAALIAGIFVVLGCVIGGEGTTKTLNTLGAVNAIAGSFTVALAVGTSVTLMTKLKLPVSTSQAVVGGIVGWNFFTGSPTDYSSLTKIFITWVTSPIIAAAFAFILFKILKFTILKKNIHLLRLDVYTRYGLIIVGALASYSLGANNIANVMGLFVSAKPFTDINIINLFSVSGTQILFLLGGIAIAIGIFTYGYNVMLTVGKEMYKISPITGFVVVLAEFLVLFLFTSQSLEKLLLNLGLPTIPLVPLSSTQAFIGAVLGVGLAKDPHSINFKVFGKISIGWVSAPIIAGVITFISLFFVQNVFEQKVIIKSEYAITDSVIKYAQNEGINIEGWDKLIGVRYEGVKEIKSELLKLSEYSEKELAIILNYAEVDSFLIDSKKLKYNLYLKNETINELKKMNGLKFDNKIDLLEKLKEKKLLSDISLNNKNYEQYFKISKNK
ncbi:MAG TPA: inorganic phosphate transporter [Melioribacteraceae bacterium]|nr:inorganic phosphate transporter [Melioribacteraceae bacterium]